MQIFVTGKAQYIFYDIKELNRRKSLNIDPIYQENNTYMVREVCNAAKPGDFA